MSRHFPSRKQDPRSVPSRVKPAFSSDRCSARLPTSVSAANPVQLGVREQVFRQQPLCLRAVSLPPGPGA